MKYIFAFILCMAFMPVASALPLEIYYTDGAGTSTILQGATLTADTKVSIPAKKAAIWGIQWNKNIDAVTGYYVYFGNDMTTPQKIRTVPNPETGKYVVTEFTTTSLNLAVGQQGCFRLKAYTTVGESGYSEALCNVHSEVKSVAYSIDGGKVVTEDFIIAGLTQGAHTMTALITFSDDDVLTRTADFIIKAPLPGKPEGVTIIKKYQ